MKTTKFFLAAILGTAVVLLLTLHLWGKEWYQVFTSLAIGVVFGLMMAVLVTNPKRFFEIIAISFLKAGAILRAFKRIKFEIKLPRLKFPNLITLVKGITRKDVFYTARKIGIGFLKTFLFIVKRFFLNLPVMLMGFGIYKLTVFEKEFGFIRNDFPLWGNIMLTSMLVMMITMTSNVLFWAWLQNYKKKHGYSQKISNWVGEIFGGTRYFWYTYFGLFLFSIVMYVVQIIRVILLLFIPTLIQVFFTIPLVLFALLKIVKESGWLILVMFSIVMGGSLGTIHSSWIIGGVATTIGFFVPVLIKLFIKKINMFFFFKKADVFLYLWRVVDPVGKY